MRFERNIGRLDVKSWITEEEFNHVSMINDKPRQELMAQSINCANLPVVFHHFALMADAHVGFGMPIGGVLALKDSICPAAVGYDIGCGVNAVKFTNIKAEDIMSLRPDVCAEIVKHVPLGEGKSCSLSKAESLLRPLVASFMKDAVFVNDRAKHAYYNQLRTLGGGNHFIELGVDVEGFVWAVVHSGSRGFGHSIGGHYMNIAQDRCHRDRINAAPGLYYLDAASEEGVAYRTAMDIALEWARTNRQLMLMAVVKAVSKVVGGLVHTSEPINVHHNYASLETHFGEQVWVHRKGATRAEEGERLVIPGNMGQGTAICTGLGNPDSFCSSSHGAGRLLGREEAKRVLDYKTEKAKLDALDVYLFTESKEGVVDEMPAAYKDFDDVLRAQADVIRLDVHIKPIAVIKG